MDLKTRLRLHRLTRAVYLPESERPPSSPRSCLLLPSRWSALVLVCAMGLLGVIGLSRTIGADAHGVEDEGAASAQSAPEPIEVSGSGQSHAPAEQSEFLVHVAGAVSAPGVVRLTPGARAVDAIEAAGGPLPDSDLDALNLAAPVADGARLYVPRLGEQAQDAEAAGSGGTLAAEQPACVDLNTADASALQTLDGIGPALAERILAFRRSSGPFASLEDLDAVPGIGPALLSRIGPGVCS